MKKISIYITLVIIAFQISSCNNQENEVKNKELEKKYKLMSVEKRQINGKLRLPGVLQPFQFVQIYPRISAYVKTVTVDRGSIVKKGTVLMTLEAPEIEQNAASAKLKYAQAYSNYLTSQDKYKRLLETSTTPGTISPYDLAAAIDRMKGDSATAQAEFANYRALETMKNYLTIFAPFDGVITERNIHPGALVGPGIQNTKAVLSLQEIAKLRLVAEIPEQYATQIDKNLPVSYKINAIPGTNFEGRISRTSNSLSSTFRAETIEIDIDNTNNQFKSGMYAEVSVPTIGNLNTFVVPKSAIITNTEKKYIVTYVNNKTKWVEVIEGNQKNDSCEIFGNIQLGDKLIINANYQIKDNQEIKVE